MGRAATAGDRCSPACGYRSAHNALPLHGSSCRNQYRTASAPELHANEIIRRPRACDAKVEAALARRFLRYRLLERLPTLAIDEKRGTCDNPILVVALSFRQRHRCRRLAPEQPQTLGSQRGEASTCIAVFLVTGPRDADTGRGMAFR